MKKITLLLSICILLLSGCYASKEETKVEAVVSASTVTEYYLNALMYGDLKEYEIYSGVDMSIQDSEAQADAIQYFIDNYSMGEYVLTSEEADLAATAFNEAIKQSAKYQVMSETIEADKAVVSINCWPAIINMDQDKLAEDFKAYLLQDPDVISGKDKSLWLINYYVDFYQNQVKQQETPVLYELVLNKINDKWVPTEASEEEISKIMQV